MLSKTPLQIGQFCFLKHTRIYEEFPINLYYAVVLLKTCNDSWKMDV